MSMNKLEKYLVELLQHNLNYNGVEVQVVKDFSHKPCLPVVTLDLTGTPSTEKVFVDYEGVETVEYYRRGTINVNLWCNSENERQSLEEQIMSLFVMEQSNHYRFCSQYREDTTCKTLNTTCKALTEHCQRAIKHKCPHPEEYGYQSLMKKYGIECESLSLEAPFELNEYDRNPPLLRSVFICEALYVDYFPVNDSTIDFEELLFSSDLTD